MPELLWLLLPVAAASGWYAAWRSYRRPSDSTAAIPAEYIQGLNYLLTEQRDKALEVFIRLVEVDSNTIETHLVLGNLFRRRGEVERAIRIHQNLIARPDLASDYKTTALLELGMDYQAAGLLDRAEGLFKEVIADGDSCKKEAYRHLLQVYEQEKDWESAIRTAVNLQAVSNQSQGCVIAHYYCELGEAKAASQPQAALQAAKKALAYDRDCVRASILLGDLALARSQYKAAIKHYNEVQEQDEDFLPVVLPRLRRAFEQSGDTAGFTRLLQRLQQRDRDLTLTLNLIDELLAQGEFDTLIELFERQLKSRKVPLKMLREYVQFAVEGRLETDAVPAKVVAALDSYLNAQTSHLCNRCGFEAKGLFWQCPGCHGWGTIKPIDDIPALRPKPHYV